MGQKVCGPMRGHLHTHVARPWQLSVFVASSLKSSLCQRRNKTTLTFLSALFQHASFHNVHIVFSVYKCILPYWCIFKHIHIFSQYRFFLFFSVNYKHCGFRLTHTCVSCSKFRTLVYLIVSAIQFVMRYLNIFQSIPHVIVFNSSFTNFAFMRKLLSVTKLVFMRNPHVYMH